MRTCFLDDSAHCRAVLSGRVQIFTQYLHHCSFLNRCSATKSWGHSCSADISQDRVQVWDALHSGSCSCMCRAHLTLQSSCSVKGAVVHAGCTSRCKQAAVSTRSIHRMCRMCCRSCNQQNCTLVTRVGRTGTVCAAVVTQHDLVVYSVMISSRCQSYTPAGNMTTLDLVLWYKNAMFREDLVPTTPVVQNWHVASSELREGADEIFGCTDENFMQHDAQNLQINAEANLMCRAVSCGNVLQNFWRYVGVLAATSFRICNSQSITSWHHILYRQRT